jgi:hypothetical protein
LIVAGHSPLASESTISTPLESHAIIGSTVEKEIERGGTDDEIITIDAMLSMIRTEVIYE